MRLHSRGASSTNNRVCLLDRQRQHPEQKRTQAAYDAADIAVIQIEKVAQQHLRQVKPVVHQGHNKLILEPQLRFAPTPDRPLSRYGYALAVTDVGPECLNELLEPGYIQASEVLQMLGPPL